MSKGNKNFFTFFRVPITAVLGLLILSGLFVYTRMETALLPSITFPKIKVIADNGEQPVNKMMVTVTKPLENAIKQVPRLRTIRSTTSRGSCEISAYMDWSADIDIAQQQIESRINQAKADLPPGVRISVEKMSPSTVTVMGYTLESKNKSPIELKLIAKYIVKPFLSQVEGVSTVHVTGGKTKEFWLELDQQKMSTFSVTPEMVRNVLEKNNFISSNGYLQDYRRLYLTITNAGLYTANQLNNTVIRNDGKRIVLLKDIAHVSVHEKTEYVKINANGKPAVLVDVLKQPQTNLVSLAQNMRKKVKELAKILPQGVYLKPYYDQADFVNDAVRSVTDSLWVGLLLAIVVAIIFLRSFKASTTILFTIPVTLALTLIVLYSIGYTFNIMTLGAIAAAIALIIDDAIVVVEQIHRTHEEHPEEPTSTLVKKAIHYLFPAMVGSSISTIVIFIPFVLMSGVAGAYFKVLTNTMIITLICSFFVTWLGLPVIYLRLTPPAKNNETKQLHRSKAVKSQRWVSFFIKRPAISILFILGLILSIWYIHSRLGTGFLPNMDEGTIVMDYATPPGTSLKETDHILRQVEKKLVKIPEVKTYSRRTGTQMGFFITEPNDGDYLIQLHKKRNKTTDQVIDEIRKMVESTEPAMRVDFGQRIEDILGDLMSSAQPIEIKVFGDDPVKLNKIAAKVADLIDKVKGTADVFDGVTIAGPYIDVIPNRAKLAQYGISLADFQFQMKTQLSGTVVGSVLEKNQETAIRMIYPNSTKTSVMQMKHAFIFLPSGKRIPVQELAHIKLNKGVAEIQRENLQSMADITARLNGRDLGSVMKDIKKTIAAHINLPQGYNVSYGGAYIQQKRSFTELLQILITASLLVFAVMLFLFKDFKVSLLILLIAVLGTAGSYIALYITGTPLNVGSYTGLIMIVGIIGENAIFTYQQFYKTMQTSSVDEAVVYSISTRLRPKLMTALGAITALMPLALGIGTGAQLHQPLAIAVIGGFVIALPLLLVVFPSLLYLVYKKRKPLKSFEGAQ